MKKTLLPVILISIFLPLFLVTRAQAAEEIQNFKALYSIQQNGTVNVTEHITYNLGSTPKHGIYRNIPLTITNADGANFLVMASNISVSGSPYIDQSTSSQIYLKIGSATTTLTGVQEYVINYTLSGAIQNYSDHNELYWSPTGNAWTVPIRLAVVNVNLPIASPNINATCYTGAMGSTAKNCQPLVSKNFANYTATLLNPSEGLTIVFGFPTGLVTPLAPTPLGTTSQTGSSNVTTSPVLPIAFTIWYILVPILVVAAWFLFGRDPKVLGAPRVLFDPPKHSDGAPLMPAETGLLTSEQVDSRDISATIVSLAIRGFLMIKKDGSGFKFTKMTPANGFISMRPFEIIIYDGLFAAGTEVSTDDLKSNFYTTVKLTNKELYSSLTNEGLFIGNPDTVRKIYASIGAAVLFTGINIPLGIILLIFSRVMPKKTALGAQKKEEALALKRFLVSQEKELDFQEKNWYFFEKLLPYAVAFGVTKEWANRFKDLAIPTDVTWYGDGSRQLFNAIILANTLNSFDRATTGFSAAPYTSTRSSSGFSSGFSSGGGFSGGGGGGGGGGGSW